jgi:hypothetical protein
LEPAGRRSITGYRIVCLARRAEGHVRAVCYSETGSGVIYDAGENGDLDLDDLPTCQSAQKPPQAYA